MKFIYLLFLLAPLLLFGACKDIPQYTADQVIIVAKNYSPDCPPSPYPSLPRIVDPFKESEPLGKSEPREPSWYVEYLGDGVWCVERDCHYKQTYFLFYEDTGKLVEQYKSCKP